MNKPSFAKSPPALVERFRALTADIPDVERRQMFGYPALFVGGNMISGLYEANWHVRVGDEARAELLQLPGAGPLEVMPGRAMGRSVVLPPSVVADDRAVRRWIDRAIDYGR